MGKPIPDSSKNSTTPIAEERPNAEPPDITTASIFSTVRSGASNSNSRVAGAPPLTSPEATTLLGNLITVQPVSASVSVQ